MVRSLNTDATGHSLARSRGALQLVPVKRQIPRGRPLSRQPWHYQDQPVPVMVPEAELLETPMSSFLQREGECGSESGALQKHRLGLIKMK